MEAAERPHLPEGSGGTQSQQPPHLRKTSKMSRDAWAPMAEQEAGEIPWARGTTDRFQVSTREMQLNRSLEESGTGAQVCGKGPEEPGAMQVFPKQCSEEGRKVNALLYRLEEAKLSIVTSQGESHPSDSPVASERKREMTDRTWPWAQIYNFGCQQSWEREAADGSRETIDAPRGPLRRQISRSDSESSGCAESRHVNRLVLNSPAEESKAGILNWLDFSAGEETGETEISPGRRSQEAEEQTSGDPAMVIEGRGDGLPWPARAPNGCHLGEERKLEEPESVKVDKKGLEIRRSTVLSLDLVSPQTRKPSKWTSSPSLESEEDEGLCGQLGFDLCSPVESLQSPETEARPLGISKSSPSMVVMLRCPSRASSEGCQASGETAWGDKPVLPLQQRKRTMQQEEEKPLKVADVKKTFEKQKPAAEKAASPARKGEMGSVRGGGGGGGSAGSAREEEAAAAAAEAAGRQRRARFFKLHERKCEPIIMTVPRKSDLFQDDLYPDTAGPEAALEAEEWFEGKNADPLLISLKHGYIPGKNRDLKVVRKNILDNKPAANKKSDLISTPKNVPDTSNPQNEAKLEEILKELRSLKDTIAHQDERISKLEQQVAKMAV
ncbi:coronin-1C [Notechis scutatus]|uniref:Coronin-1C n=1 Tax=Notechis scutatus TaxID=8663 RepID=A0A6J1VKY2_9SAUR|nr:coronin-1C [Notechis scutatus]